ncbi:hypothetical protein PS662_01601 [Pseudomonas fluorescens]|uniref:Uncharacterized protein n=1 Tax=Pseudomonas fluorescens TaxID=294 RepID=A0A5E6RS24_PSEFL|nr:hypothetical protein PS662_01601 [Pseudomonas fluorescens]
MTVVTEYAKFLSTDLSFVASTVNQQTLFNGSTASLDCYFWQLLRANVYGVR